MSFTVGDFGDMLMVRIYKDNQNVCKLIAELTGVEKEVTRDILGRLEKQAALPGVDVRLTGEIYGKAHSKMRELGLDSRDTTPRELYQALYNLTELHDNFLSKRIGVKHPGSAAEVASAIERYITESKIPREVLALKHTTLKKLLKNTPPKNLMKALHYRSLESMLKRESSVMLLTVARHFEPIKWQERFLQSYRKLETNDFEMREIEVLHLAGRHWQSVGDQFSQSCRNNILHAPEAAGIALLPLKRSPRTGLTLAGMLLTLHYINEIRSISTYFKFHHLRPELGVRLAEQTMQNKQDHLKIAGQPVHWRIIHRYYGSKNKLSHPEMFEPHVQAEDLAYRKAEEVLYRLEPALHFWHELDYVGLSIDGKPLSFNLTDMAMNLVNSLPYEKRVHYHLGESVWNELYLRYTSFPAVEQDILSKLEETSAVENPIYMVGLQQEQITIKPKDILADMLSIDSPASPRTRRPVKRRDPTSKVLDMEFVW